MSKKSKKHSKDSSESSTHQTNKSKDHISQNCGDDLLSLEWDKPISSSTTDLLDINGIPASGDDHNTASFTEHHSSKKTSFFLQKLVSNHICNLTYSVSATANEVIVKWKCTNTCHDTISVVVALLSSPSIKKFPPGQECHVATNLPSGASNIMESKFSLCHPLTDHIVVGANIILHRATSMTQDTTSFTGSLQFHAVSGFSRYKLTDSEFQEKIAKSSRKWSNSSVQIPSSSKSKASFKGLAAFLHAHIVETDVSNAACMSAKSPAGCKIFILAKLIPSGTAIQVDIKCLANEINDSQVMANVIVASLRDIVL